MKNNAIIVVVALCCVAAFFGFSKMQTANAKKDITAALYKEYGYSEAKHVLTITMDGTTKAVAKVTESNDPVMTWDIHVAKNDTGWGLSADQAQKDKSELDLFSSIGNSITQQVASRNLDINAPIPGDIKILYGIIKHKYPKYSSR